MKKIISFSLWGDDPKYTVGAVRNVELARQHYKGWMCRFYIGEHTPSHEYNWLSRQHDVECVQMPEKLNSWRGMYARFFPASEEDVQVFISRDCDSRLGKREAAAVNEWLSSPKLVHSMGDHPFHFNPSLALMGGMFGMKRHACEDMRELVEDFMDRYSNQWQCDQDFLRERIFPRVIGKVLAHSDIHPNCTRFPMPREGNNFIGSIIGPDNERLHPEHHEMIK